jgi:hypothetical protein
MWIRTQRLSNAGPDPQPARIETFSSLPSSEFISNNIFLNQVFSEKALDTASPVFSLSYAILWIRIQEQEN